MSEEMIVRHCSPTLAGMKTGNLFSCPFADEQELMQTIRSWNRTLGKKGLRVLPLRCQNHRALIYVYRPSRLSRDLQDSSACKLLLERGYPSPAPAQCISRLIQRIGESPEFPHEIGLFLGYPPEDVSGFIENRAGGCKCAGCWKVYGDEAAAKRLFAKYKKCTQAYCTQWERGKSLEWLAVQE